MRTLGKKNRIWYGGCHFRATMPWATLPWQCRLAMSPIVYRMFFLFFARFDPDFALDGARIRRNSKHESCKSTSYHSIAIWITWIGGRMSELWSERYDVAKLTGFSTTMTLFIRWPMPRRHWHGIVAWQCRRECTEAQNSTSSDSLRPDYCNPSIYT